MYVLRMILMGFLNFIFVKVRLNSKTDFLRLGDKNGRKKILLDLFRGALFTKVKLFDLFEEKRAYIVKGVRSKRK